MIDHVGVLRFFSGRLLSDIFIGNVNYDMDFRVGEKSNFALTFYFQINCKLNFCKILKKKIHFENYF